MEKYIIFAGALALALASCSSDEKASVEIGEDLGHQQIILSRTEKEVANASYTFGWSLLEKANEEKPNENVCLSPVSASIVLSMLINGAEGETRQEIVNALGLNGLSVDEINENSQFMASKLLMNDKDVQVYMANSMWIVNDMPVKDKFKRDMASIFDCYVANTTYSKYASDINDWCSEQTKGLIPNYMDEGQSSDLALLNALYFKSIWDKDTKLKSAGDKKFTNCDGYETMVPFITGKNHYKYNETENARYAHIAFKDWNYEFLIGLPKTGHEVKDCISELKDLSIIRESINSDLDLTFPKFSLYGKQSIEELLKTLGIEKVFTHNAELPNISVEPTFVNKFDQAVSFSVDEKGAVAAAVTSSEILSMSPYMPEIDLPMVVDRPFVFAIYEYSTNCLLFAGKIEKL